MVLGTAAKNQLPLKSKTTVTVNTHAPKHLMGYNCAKHGIKLHHSAKTVGIFREML